MENRLGSDRAPDVLTVLASRPLSDLAPLRPFRAGDLLGQQGERCDYLHILARGQALLCRTGADGSRSALYLLGPGDLFGEGSLQKDPKWLVTARAVTDGAVHLLPAAHLPRLAQYYPQLTSHLVTLLSLRLEWAHQRVDLIKSTGSRERLLELLRLLAAAHGMPVEGGTRLLLPLTQAELGSLAGLARETVVRSFAELEAAGLVRRKGRRELWVATQPDGSTRAA